MKDEARLYLQKAENEIAAAQVLFEVSQNSEVQQLFRLEKEFTFYSSVISHSYYCIFYSAKALLADDDIETDAPEVHRKTVETFDKHFVKTGKLDVKLLLIYKTMIMRADELLGIFLTERWKRGEYTYQKLPQANKEPARDSLDNASLFFKNAFRVLH